MNKIFLISLMIFIVLSKNISPFDCKGILWGLDLKGNKVGNYYNYSDIFSYGISTCNAIKDNYGKIGSINVLPTGDCWKNPVCSV